MTQTDPTRKQLYNLYFLRHGQSIANENRIFAGQQDVSMTDHGLEQAARSGEAIKGSSIIFDTIISSPLQRAYQTARTVASIIEYPEADILVNPQLMERGMGMFEGELLDTMAGVFEEEKELKGVESLNSLSSRALQIVKTLDSEYTQGENVLLVSHAGFGRMLQTMIAHQSPDKMYDQEPIPNSTLIKLI